LNCNKEKKEKLHNLKNYRIQKSQGANYLGLRSID